MAQQREAVWLLLEDEPRQGDSPFAVRLRVALKALLRAHGLRCRRVSGADDGEALAPPAGATEAGAAALG